MSLIDALAELNPGALLLEPRDVFDSAVVGITTMPDDHWPRELPSQAVAVYDYDLLVEAQAAQCGDDVEPSEAHLMAVEWIEHNTIGAYAGEATPVVTRRSDG